ncbi:RNA methyltransferase [Microbacterium foliorum]|uniref:TrmH family RNA methyltransferase n=1 Tax=Microbacterium foliorum TaxID=104336 RepID=UPI0005ECC1BE|nr:RNA methyltransferase [Microbacterium foliorum]AXL12089.1 RNA methyltransferase [Microbacterium foliorum]
MELLTVTDADDRRLDDYRGLTDTALRTRSDPSGGLYIAESTKVIARAVAAGHRPRSVLVQERRVEDIRAIVGDLDVPVYVVPDAVAEAVTGFAVHRGTIASMHRPELPSVREVIEGASVVLILENIGDHTNVCDSKTRVPGPPRRARSRIAILEGLADHANVGSAMRNAAALGIDAVLVTPTCSDPLYRRSVRVSMGTVFQVPWTRIPEWPAGIHELQDAGYVVAGMTLGEGAITLDELVAEDHEKLALVFGTEGDGITPATDRLLDRRVTIPMMGGVDSLNVAAATAVTFYATR